LDDLRLLCRGGRFSGLWILPHPAH
jgi:hypothetical protein